MGNSLARLEPLLASLIARAASLPGTNRPTARSSVRNREPDSPAGFRFFLTALLNGLVGSFITNSNGCLMEGKLSGKGVGSPETKDSRPPSRTDSEQFSAGRRSRVAVLRRGVLEKQGRSLAGCLRDLELVEF